jgi:hypothetical protein
MYFWTLTICTKQMYLWTSCLFLHDTMYFLTSCYFLCEAECIYELRIILCIKQCIYELRIIFFCVYDTINFRTLSLFVRIRMYLWTSYHFFGMTQCDFELCNYSYLYEAECIYELRIILCMKQNIFLNFL